MSEENEGATVQDERPDFGASLRLILEKRENKGIVGRELGVSFKNLSVVGVQSTANYQPTFASILDPRYIWESLNALRRPALHYILHRFDGVIQPGQMLLVIGNPGSGCTTFLKALANQRKEYHSVSGDVKYGPFDHNKMANLYRGDISFCAEEDVHFPSLTVDQTLRFASKMRAPKHNEGFTNHEEYVSSVSTMLESTFGLSHAKDTFVGDAALRGVSGGEKKRVSLTEALACRSRLGIWDNPTHGLDASTALEFVQTMRQITDIGRIATVMSLYQAGESLYEVFDKVCVIYAGRMVYFGPRVQAKQYFVDLGFEAGARQTTSDFLAEVTDARARRVREGFEYSAPRTADEFAERYFASPIYQQNAAEVDQYRAQFVANEEKAMAAYHESVLAEQTPAYFRRDAYTVSLLSQIKSVTLRKAQIVRGNKGQEFAQLGTFIFQGIIVGSIFYKLSPATFAWYSRGGIIFFALLFASLTAMAEIPALFSQRRIVFKHFQSAMYHPFVEALALTLVDIPISAIVLAVFSVILYFMVRFQEFAGKFFIFYLFIFLMTITMKAYFRGITAGFNSAAPAQAIVGMVFIIFSFYTGYILPKPTMIGALRWLTYINPMKYGFEALMANEFHNLNGPCSTLVPRGAGYENVSVANQVCTVVGSEPGSATVNGDRYIGLSFEFYYKYIWRNLGIDIAFFIFFVFLLLFFTEINIYSSIPSSTALYLRNSNSPKPTAPASDEEKGSLESSSGMESSEKKVKQPVEEQVPSSHKIFAWRHVQYDITMPDKTVRRLLDDVSGYVAPGKLTALMGQSGAGKTTLLNVLAQRTTSGVISGDMLVDGNPVPKNFTALTGYCQQTDVHLGSSTVREALQFSANLRQPKSVPQHEKEAYVETVLNMVGLERYGDAIIGTLGPEARKRTTIGVELAAKPDLLLFLDEPTSGLDAQSAWGIMTCLKQLAHRGLAILCTIHQPSAELFEMFDRLLLLQKGGQTVFFGDIGEEGTHILNYFEHHSGMACPPRANPAEYVLDVIGAGSMGTAAKSGVDWNKIWLESTEAVQLEKELDVMQENKKSEDQAPGSSFVQLGWLSQVKYLVKREFQRHWRDPVYLMAKLFLNVGGGLFIALTFLKSKDTIQGTQNKLFAIYITLGQGLSLANQMQVPYFQTRDVFDVRERSTRMYSWSALLTSQFLGEAPIDVFMSSLYFLVWYWTVGFMTSRGGYTYLIIGIVWPLHYMTLAFATAAMSATAQSAALAYSFFSAFSMIFNGTLQPYNRLGWWKWMNRVSPYTYIIEGVLGQSVGHSEITCSDLELVTLTPPSGLTCGQYLDNFVSSFGGYITQPDATDSCSYCSARTTDEFLSSQFNVQYNHHWRDFGILMGYVAFNILITYVITWLRQPKRKA